MDSQISKASFVMTIGVILNEANSDVETTDLINDETVLVTFKGGHTKQVNIAADSRMAILKDIIRAVE